MAGKGMSAVRTVLLAIRKSTDAQSGDGDDTPVVTPPVTRPRPTPPQVPQGQAAPQATATPQPQPAPPTVDPQSLEYPGKRDAAQALLTALQQHRQSAHVAGETGAATTALAQAATHANAAQWPQALAEVEKARKACVDGKGFADSFQAYVAGPRRSATDAIAAATAAGIAAGPHQAKLGQADTKAAPATRDYAGATADVEQIGTDIGTALIDKYIVPSEQSVQAHKTSAVKDFLKPLTDQIDAKIVQTRQFVADKAFGQVRLGRVALSRLLIAADKMAPRRKAFEDQRPLTVTELDKVKAIAALALPHAALSARLAQADQQASFAAQHMEDGELELKALVLEAQAFLDLHTAALAYSTERQARHAALQALDQHKAAAQIVKERDAARALLAAAVTAAGDTGAVGAALALKADRSQHDLPKAMALMAQLAGDQALATSVADGLGGVADAKAAVTTANDAGSFDTALRKLKTDLAAARSAPDAKLAAKPFDQAAKAISNCESHVKKAAFPKARTELDTACARLAEGRRLQVEHARFVQQHEALSARLKLLKKAPEAGGIKPALAALDQALDQAKAQDKKAEFVNALALLRDADAAAAKADAALVWRRTFDTRVAAVEKSLAGADYASLKKPQLAQVKAARGQANKLAFDAATKALDAVEAAMANADVMRLAKAAPNDAKLLARAKDLKAKGGPKALDDPIASLPTDVSKTVFAKLAQERFGVVVMSTDADSANTAASLKQMCNLFAKIPDVVMDNPSLAKVEHTATGGAAYISDDSLVTMNSRPTPNSKADFRKGPDGRLPSDRLPANREASCMPANDKPEDLFDFNSIHEVGHTIDDANNFMASRLGASNTEFAGWLIHGADVKPIADAVARKFHYDGNDDQKRYVLDKIVGNPIVVPLDDTGAEPADWKSARDDIDAWHTNATTSGVWSDQSKSMAIDIDGRIYQESYPGQWMSYQTAARSRGITGYQFRAPGEWFSELFAAYKLGKLKKGHPSEGWLSTLSV